MSACFRGWWSCCCRRWWRSVAVVAVIVLCLCFETCGCHCCQKRKKKKDHGHTFVPVVLVSSCLRCSTWERWGMEGCVVVLLQRETLMRWQRSGLKSKLINLEYLYILFK